MLPSEDDRAAEAFLRDHAPPRRNPRVIGELVRNFIHNTIQLTSGLQEEDAPHNVLAQRHKNNQPPELSQHSTAALHQAEDDPQESDDDEDQDKAQVAPPLVIVDSVRNFVHNTTQLTSCHDIQEEGAPRNVLAQHHKTNRSNQPPGLSQLSTAARRQAMEHDQDEEDNPQESDNEGQDQDQARAARHSKSTGEIKPDTMAYYKGTPWWAILMQAKIKYRRHIAVNHGFPDCDQYLVDAHDILLEVIDEFKTENEVHDQGELYLLYIYTFTYCLLRFPSCA